MIEFTHRASSGLALLAVIVMVIWAHRAFPARHLVRKGASASLVLIVIEALLGAGLVLFELVADNSSSFRAFAMAAHLVNTFLLVAALSLTAWWASGGKSISLRAKPTATRLMVPALLGMLVVGATGAIVALGDTLFPAETLASGLRDSFSSDAHPLTQLRKYHPLLAIFVGLYLVAVARHLRRRAKAATDAFRIIVAVTTGLYLTQLLVGVVNLVLLAPVAMQLIHLLLADVVWISAVLLMAIAPAERLDADMAAAPSRGPQHLRPSITH